jgi:hypothetical protein
VNFARSAMSHNQFTSLTVLQKCIDECTFTAEKHTQTDKNFTANNQNTKTEEHRGITRAWHSISGLIPGSKIARLIDDVFHMLHGTSK